jgi:hypothetical protein
VVEKGQRGFIAEKIGSFLGSFLGTRGGKDVFKVGKKVVFWRKVVEKRSKLKVTRGGKDHFLAYFWVGK